MAHRRPSASSYPRLDGRFSTVRLADLIVVLDRGRVVEQGSHADLLHHNGGYAELCSLQARAYR